MLDVLIAGAGPAGAIAARALALRGARVLMVDRDAFPRDKLCGDTLNPGALRLLAGIGLTGGALDAGLPIGGMRVTGPGASVIAPYREGQRGLSLLRRDFDAWLVEQAVAAGVRFETGRTAQAALTFEAGGTTVVRGLVLRDHTGAITRMPASVTIAADGRRSAVARSVGLGVTPSSPRRWAYGGHFPLNADDRAETGPVFGEMHVRRGWYAGAVRVPGDLMNVCVVVDQPQGGGVPLALMRQYLARDPELDRRFGAREPVSPLTVLGPLAIDVPDPGVPGLFMAGDAAGFVDPMTGDGLNLAMHGALLAADEAMRVLESGDWTGAVERLKKRRMTDLGSKLRFNRWVRALTSSPASVQAAGFAARIAPGVVRRLVAAAGDAA